MTTFDVIGGVELTAGAAIVVAALSIVLGHDVRARLKLAAGLSAWFALVVVLAATRVLDYEHGIGTPGVGLAVVAPIVLMWIGLMRVPALRAALNEAPLWVLAGVNAGRILGVSFLILYSAGQLPAPFAPLAGWGDIIVGLTAVPVAWMASQKLTGWRPVLLAWNTLGLADFINAVTLAALSSPGPLRQIFGRPDASLMSTLPWLLIPGFLVPLLAITHLAIFYRLFRSTASKHVVDASPGSCGYSVRGV